jgi:hypothetical protein
MCEHPTATAQTETLGGGWIGVVCHEHGMRMNAGPCGEHVTVSTLGLRVALGTLRVLVASGALGAAHSLGGVFSGGCCFWPLGPPSFL